MTVPASNALQTLFLAHIFPPLFLNSTTIISPPPSSSEQRHNGFPSRATHIMPLLAEERETQAWEGNSRTVQTRPDDPNEPPPSAQPRSEDDLNEVHMNSDDERSFQDTEQTTCVQETQLIDVEIDTQALDYSLSPVHRGPLNEENTHIRVVSAPVPQLALERTATKPAVTEEFFTRPATESLEEMNSGFKFGPAVRPKEGSYTRPLPGSKAREEQATNPSVPGAPKQTDSHMPIAEKGERDFLRRRYIN